MSHNSIKIGKGSADHRCYLAKHGKSSSCSSCRSYFLYIPFILWKGHKFWRIVNEGHLPRSWVINQIKFYTGKHAQHPLPTPDFHKAFASSSYLGYDPGSAFDNKSSTYWLPNGWYDRGAGEDFIGYEFPEPVAINSVRIVHQSGQGNVVSKKMYVEAADAYGGPYTTKWIIENSKGKSSKRFNNKSKCRSREDWQDGPIGLSRVVFRTSGPKLISLMSLWWQNQSEYPIQLRLRNELQWICCLYHYFFAYSVCSKFPSELKSLELVIGILINKPIQ